MSDIDYERFAKALQHGPLQLQRTYQALLDAHERGRREGIEAAAKVFYDNADRPDSGPDNMRVHVHRGLQALLPTPPPQAACSTCGKTEDINCSNGFHAPQAAEPPETCSMCGGPVWYIASGRSPGYPSLQCYRESDSYAFVHCKNAMAVRRGDYPPPAPPAVPAGEGPTADQWERALELLACVCHGVDTGPIVDFLREVGRP